MHAARVLTPGIFLGGKSADTREKPGGAVETSRLNPHVATCRRRLDGLSDGRVQHEAASQKRMNERVNESADRCVMELFLERPETESSQSQRQYFA